jgi:hypothetical protein
MASQWAQSDTTRVGQWGDVLEVRRERGREAERPALPCEHTAPVLLFSVPPVPSLRRSSPSLSPPALCTTTRAALQAARRRPLRFEHGAALAAANQLDEELYRFGGRLFAADRFFFQQVSGRDRLFRERFFFQQVR